MGVLQRSFWWGLGGLLLLCGCGDKGELGVVVQGRKMDVVDMHLHPGEWEKIPPATQRFLASRFPFPFGLDPESLASSVLTGKGILAELDKARVRVGVLFAVYAPKTVGITTNEFVISQLKTDPKRLVGLASLRVDRWEQEKEEQLKALRAALLSPGMVGIKLAHAHMHFRMDDPRYDGIFKLAGELDKPVYLHTGTSPFPGISQKVSSTNPAYFEETIKRHPKAKFILGHLGYDSIAKKHGFLADCLRLAKTYANVYLEPSALGSRSSDPDGAKLKEAMQKIRAQGSVDRVIYGSDGPQSPGFVKEYLERTITAMERAGYSLDEIEAVLGKNFLRVFNVPAGAKAP